MLYINMYILFRYAVFKILDEKKFSMKSYYLLKIILACKGRGTNKFNFFLGYA